MSDCNINSCCFCINLETGGKIWGWLGIIFGILSLIVFNSIAAMKYFIYLDAMKSYEVFISIIAVITIIVSLTLLIGIKMKSHKMLKPTLMLALYSYIAIVLFTFYIYCIFDFSSIIIREKVNENLGYYNIILYPYFSDSSFDGIDSSSTTTQPELEISIEDKAFAVKNIFVAIVSITITIDFVFRYLVIDSLYQKYKDKSKSSNVV